MPRRSRRPPSQGLRRDRRAWSRTCRRGASGGGRGSRGRGAGRPTQAGSSGARSKVSASLKERPSRACSSPCRRSGPSRRSRCMSHGRSRRESEDDDLGRPVAEIADPLLQAIEPGPDSEPQPRELLKGESKRHHDAATGTPAAGRSGLQEARRKGPLGWLQLLGPGLITGASDDDPSGIGTYSQVGSQFGYGFLWAAPFTFPLMAAVQELCARIALHTGVGLGVALRRKFPRPLVGACIAALFLANTVNAGADLGAIAAGGSLLTRGALHQLWFVVPAAILILTLQVFMTYALIFKVFKWLTVALFAYVIT